MEADISSDIPADVTSPNSSLQLPCPPEAADTFLSAPTPGVLETLRRAAGPVLVLGAGGKMGLHLCAMLARGFEQIGRKEKVIAVSRFSTLRDREAFARFGVETMPCDLADPRAVAALPDAPTIFFLAGVKFGTSESPELLRKFNAEMPRLVAKRFARSRIVAFSTGCVYPYVARDSGGADELTPIAPPGEYAQSCAAREVAFADVSRGQGTRVALVRLNYSIEFRYGVLVDIAEKVRSRQPIDLTMGYVNVIWQADAVAHAIQSLDIAASPAAPINITGPEILSVRELAVRFGKLFGTSPQFTGVESGTAWLNNAARSHRLFGRPSVSVDQMIEWIAAWLERGGETWHKPTGFERRDGKF